MRLQGARLAVFSAAHRQAHAGKHSGRPARATRDSMPGGIAEHSGADATGPANGAVPPDAKRRRWAEDTGQQEHSLAAVAFPVGLCMETWQQVYVEKLCSMLENLATNLH